MSHNNCFLHTLKYQSIGVKKSLLNIVRLENSKYNRLRAGCEYLQKTEYEHSEKLQQFSLKASVQLLSYYNLF